MSRVRRPRYLTIFFEERPLLGVEALLAGRLDLDRREHPFAVSLLDGEEHRLSEPELTALARIPSSVWTPLEEAVDRLGLGRETIERLVGRGLLLSDRPDPLLAELARRDEALGRQGWYRHAAVYHYTSRWYSKLGQIDLGDRPVSIQEAVPESAAAFDRLVERFGAPPGPFHQRPDAGPVVALPRVEPEGPLFELLAQRKTTRLFDRDRLLPLESLSTLLATVFGCRGTARLARGVEVVRKTSPSGGALHPVEVYPLITAVEGIDSGLYHYSVQHHGLERLRALSTEAARELAERVCGGQSYFSSAHVLFLLTARFLRNFWRYRNHRKAYRLIQLEAGHLSQTLYLVSTALGLGAFITAAVSEEAMEEALGIDGVEEGALAICGCGVRLPTGVGLALETVPYSPEAPGETAPAPSSSRRRASAARKSGGGGEADDQ